jgi:hypothetical protein
MARFHLGVMNDDLTKEIWSATNVPVRAKRSVVYEIN